MRSLEREPLLESRRRTYGDFSGLGRLNTLADIQSSTSSSTLYEEDEIRVTLGKQFTCQNLVHRNMKTFLQCAY